MGAKIEGPAIGGSVTNSLQINPFTDKDMPKILSNSTNLIVGGSVTGQVARYRGISDRFAPLDSLQTRGISDQAHAYGSKAPPIERIEPHRGNSDRSITRIPVDSRHNLVHRLRGKGDKRRGGTKTSGTGEQ
jgi:hypothetical protein